MRKVRQMIVYWFYCAPVIYHPWSRQKICIVIYTGMDKMYTMAIEMPLLQ